MKVVAVLGGLGSQMLKYAFYTDIKKKCGDEDCYIDTTAFHTMKMWNGYELERIFGIHDRDLYDTYSEAEKEEASGQPYRVTAMKQMQKIEPERTVYCINRGKVIKYGTEYSLFVRLKNKVQSVIDQYWYGRILKDDRHIDRYPSNYLTLNGNIFYDEFNHTSDLYFKDSKDEIKRIFTFPDFSDERNKAVAEQMLSCESVAIHVRRSDHMYDNASLFEEGYFKKSADYIRQYAKNPVFYIFSEETDWCRTHLDELGIRETDSVTFIDWNQGMESFRDMQLMTYCKHNVLAISSFSWWGNYLSCNTEGKISCAPEGYWFDVEKHF